MANLFMNDINLGPVIKVEELPTININEHAIYEICRDTLTKENPIGPSMAVGVFTTHDRVAGTYCTVDLSLNTPGEPMTGWYLRYPGGESVVYWEYTKDIVADYLMHYDETISRGGWTFNCNDFIVPDVEDEPVDYCFVTIWNKEENKLEVFARTKDVDAMFEKFNKKIHEYYHYDKVNDEWIRIDEAKIFIPSTDTDDGKRGIVPAPTKAYIETALLSNGEYDYPKIIYSGYVDSPISDTMFDQVRNLPFHNETYIIVSPTKVNIYACNDFTSTTRVDGTLITTLRSRGTGYLCTQSFESPENNIKAYRQMVRSTTSPFSTVNDAIIAEIQEHFQYTEPDCYWKNINDESFSYGNTGFVCILPSSKMRNIEYTIGYEGISYLYLPEWVPSWISTGDGILYTNAAVVGREKNISDVKFVPNNKPYCAYTSIITRKYDFETETTVADLTANMTIGHEYIFPKNYHNFVNVDSEPEDIEPDLLYIVHE